jgi:hypothetical protein
MGRISGGREEGNNGGVHKQDRWRTRRGWNSKEEDVTRESIGLRPRMIRKRTDGKDKKKNMSRTRRGGH